ncbi:MAG: hypothetical protein QOJ29_1861 [Thermoleophilaceae bacterium]|jgi:hypothetical protein|nr:hypothetical protein [Thermoleophilaceae bacterium]
MAEPPLVEGPLARELREIGERESFPDTQARRHHFVPAFHLARFADPVGARKGRLFQLDVNTGRPQRTTPDDTAFGKDLYAQDSEDGSNNVLESFFSVVERHAPLALKRLIDDPLGCSPEDRQTLSFFLVLQFTRTPPALDHSNAHGRRPGSVAGIELQDAKAFADFYLDKMDAQASAEKIERARRHMLDQLASGQVSLANPKGMAIKLLVENAAALGETVAGLEWTVLRVLEDELVTSDRALAMYDSDLEFPWSGNAWESSPSAETTFPLSPDALLVLRPGMPGIGEAEADRRLAEQVNLRTYGWASRYIYGSSQQVVSQVRAQAKQRPDWVPRPRVPRQLVLEQADENDPTVGLEHVKRGWPRGLWVDDDQGRPRFMSYRVIDPDDPAVIQGILKPPPHWRPAE